MKLHTPPYLQIALDLIDLEELERILADIPHNSKIMLEAGTPLIKKFGISILQTIIRYHPKSYVIADLKTLDVGWLEVQIAAEKKAAAVVISGLASIDTIESSLEEGKKQNVDIILDLMNVDNPLILLEQLSRTPEIVLFHRGIDQEGKSEHPWEVIREIKNNFKNTLVAVAGGLDLKTSSKALASKADIIVIGRAITQAKEVESAVNNFIKIL